MFNIKTWMFLFVLYLLSSCVNTIEEDGESVADQGSNIVIKTSAKNLLKQIYNPDHKAYIGFYLLQGSVTINKDRYLDNIKLLCTNSELKSDKPIYYPDSKVKCKFVGYYPYTEKGAEDKSAVLSVTVLDDQTTSIYYNTSDFMTCDLDNITPSTKIIDLSFQHRMAQIILIIKCAEGTSVSSLKNSNPKAFITNTYINASYNLDDHSFFNFSNNKAVIPYGQWAISDNKLIGKKCLLIPQSILSSTKFISLIIGDRTYECRVPESLLLKSGEAKELIINYDSRVSLSDISISISDWNDGGSSTIVAEDKDEKEYISIDEIEFDKTNVYTVYNRGNPVAQICKELLCNGQISEESVVVYLYKNGRLDDANGVVWQLGKSSTDDCISNIEWSRTTNSFTIRKGSHLRSRYLYLDQHYNISFTRPENTILLSLNGEFISDNRVTEIYKYPIVKIGTSYWMRENLRATKYHTGKSLTLKKESTYNKTSGGYFEIYNHRFYNLNAIKTSNLAPNGWHISTELDWERLNSYISGSTSYIKQLSVWGVTEPLSNNSSYFSAIPTGIFTKKVNDDKSIFAFQNQYAIYWKMSNNLKDIADKAISISYASDNLKDATYSEFSGYCIRCVRD